VFDDDDARLKPTFASAGRLSGCTDKARSNIEDARPQSLQQPDPTVAPERRA